MVLERDGPPFEKYRSVPLFTKLSNNEIIMKMLRGGIVSLWNQLIAD